MQSSDIKGQLPWKDFREILAPQVLCCQVDTFHPRIQCRDCMAGGSLSKTRRSSVERFALHCTGFQDPSRAENHRHSGHDTVLSITGQCQEPKQAYYTDSSRTLVCGCKRKQIMGEITCMMKALGYAIFQIIKWLEGQPILPCIGMATQCIALIKGPRLGPRDHFACMLPVSDAYPDDDFRPWKARSFRPRRMLSCSPPSIRRAKIAEMTTVDSELTNQPL